MSLIEVRDEGTIRWIGLNRPEKRNAIDRATTDAFSAAVDDARERPCVLIVHSTTPGIFAAGADIAELRDRDADAALLAFNAALFEKLEAHRWPTIAAIDGAALGGGCELALACDLRVASDKAFFAQPELSLGILAGAGGGLRFFRQLVDEAGGERLGGRQARAGVKHAPGDLLPGGLGEAPVAARAGQDAERGLGLGEERPG